jgi:tripartite-type tricarboxylate transporter receptor subunit TctC
MQLRALTICLFALVAALTGAVPVVAQEWPQRTVRLVVGYGAGGGTDLVARIIAQALQDKLKQPFVVENKVGASGIVAAESVSKAEKDGYTLYLVNNAHIIVGVMNKSLPYDTLTSFEPIGQAATGSLVIASRPDFPAKNIKELIALARSSPGKITFASVGNGTTQHFTGELLMQVAGINMLHVPFRNSPAATSGVMGKHVDLMIDTVSAVLGPVQGGELRALAVTGRERYPAIPDVPTAIESGLLPDYEVTTWYGLVAPAGTPKAIISKINAALNEIVTDKAVQERLAKVGAIAAASSIENFRDHMKSELKRWGDVRAAARIEQQ